MHLFKFLALQISNMIVKKKKEILKDKQWITSGMFCLQNVKIRDAVKYRYEHISKYVQQRYT